MKKPWATFQQFTMCLSIWRFLDLGRKEPLDLPERSQHLCLGGLWVFQGSRLNLSTTEEAEKTAASCILLCLDLNSFRFPFYRLPLPMDWKSFLSREAVTEQLCWSLCHSPIQLCSIFLIHSLQCEMTVFICLSISYLPTQMFGIPR